MSTQKTQGEASAAATPGMRRRGLIAGAAAIAAAALAARAGSDQPVAAAGNGAALTMGNNDNTTNAPTLTTTLAVPNIPGFRVKVTATGATIPPTPDATADGVQGYATNPNPQTAPITSNSGVHGRNDDLNGIGTTGVATSGTGVYGQSTNGSGVGGSSQSGAAFYGQSTSGTGVSGISTSGEGVFGQSQSNNGIHGLSNGSYGVVGVTTAAGFGGCTGVTETTGAAAFSGGTHNPSAFAAFFAGATVVQGNFSVTGTKSAAVPHKDGTHRLVYCIESPESWFEDFGEAQLVGGKAVVALDPEFTAIVHSDKYYVYVTAHGDTKGLFIAGRTADGFTVAENQGGTSGVSFAWRAVAKRADIPGERLAKFEMPKIKMPDEAKLAAAHAAGPAGVAPLPRRKP